MLEDVKRVVDLCAAPGSWSQVLAKQIWEPNKDNAEVKIVAVDLQDMAPIEGVIQMKGDITKLSTAESIIGHFAGNKADLVVSDGAPDVTGLHDMDQYIQSQLILAAVNITTHVLRVGGTFVAKIFRGRDISLLYSQLKVFFKQVTVVKPKSSRNSSIESFVLCQDYCPPIDYQPSMITPMLLPNYDEKVPMVGSGTLVVPFMACGDLSGFDADRNYDLDEDYKPHEAVQKPINPPYQQAIEVTKKTKKNTESSNNNNNNSEDKSTLS